MDWQTIIAYLFGLGLIYLFIWILYYPLKITTKIILNTLGGAILLIFLNLIGRFFNYIIPINPVTALVIGFLGIPGVILLIILKFLIL
ncbi:SigmaK-factor processing regulatory BofA [Anoxybacter fermentans]|uniref:SigmaK-factor processing regulatory BofA n=1 Tax=Anoxybacter fermentans TaxID=1323375 RepID=A0A3Q9HS41_9FIRM|nr:pro-sigmaK processing inhibitor BofA family protein [Anoxybacter fermentans]AZR74403.1 SigmaK-factor processing regulatory BofA [Anoxybacter fermentans]